MKAFIGGAARSTRILQVCRLVALTLIWSGAAAERAPLVTIQIRPDHRLPGPIPRGITGKFAEHLGNNIYNGMDAQILRNPTFADVPFWSGQMTPDGITTFFYEHERIGEEMRRRGARQGWPGAELDALVQARHDGLACWWARSGSRDGVVVSPDTGPFGGRAQRLEGQGAGAGIHQWTYLPLHRTNRFEVEIFARSASVQSLRAELSDGGKAKAEVSWDGLGREWGWFRGTLTLPADSAADKAYRFSLAGEQPGGWVIGRAFLRPADHIAGADLDVIRFLRESRLPILRWPGGNFVSAYHWEDGIGPLEKRPTRPNYAWGSTEPNLFGTDEFVAFCRAVNCEPMICLNAGDGTVEEAERWVEYCNGPVTSPMGSLRAAHGHAEPYGIVHWEIGNELWGKWQAHWTSASGYVDRYLQFARRLKQIDSKLRLYACGAPVLWGKEWNDTLVAGAGAELQVTTDHPLVGGTVRPTAAPWDVYRDFMAVPGLLETRWAALRDQMKAAGTVEPRLAVTELQMFARLGPREGEGNPVKLTQANLVGPPTMAEAVYDTLIYHACIRLLPFAEMVTHSATVNHGGGLRKERERVYANPCHYAQGMFSAFAGAQPVELSSDAELETAPKVLGDLQGIQGVLSFPAVAAVAAVSGDGELLVSLVNPGTRGARAIRIRLERGEFLGKAEAKVLCAGEPWAANSLADPERVRPEGRSYATGGSTLEMELPPVSVALVRVKFRSDGRTGR